MADQKIEAAAQKPPLNLIPISATIGAARVYGYGARKYAAGNYYSASLEDGAGGRYIAAALRHLGSMQEPSGLHTPSSLAAVDVESGLPHIDHAICGLLMLRAILSKSGTVPVDPGPGSDPSPRPTAADVALVEYRLKNGGYDFVPCGGDGW